ncbi:MAG: acylneuraminate cytidylyltransferase family protein, partial [Nanoarchaeota archaeon]
MVGKQNKKIVAIIPARGGSKRIPRKNIKLLAGKPLIAYTIEAAKRSASLDRIFVSTEDEEIAKVASYYGAEIIKRPDILATDNATTESVLCHAVNNLEKEGYFPELVVLLQPTSPLRGSYIIDKAV